MKSPFKATVLTFAVRTLSLFACLAVAQEPPMAPPMMPPMAPPAAPAPAPATPQTPAAIAGEVIPAQPAPDPAATAPERTGEARDPARDDELISITLDNVPLVDVIRMFTRISGANIIAAPTGMDGAVTVSLTNVKWRPALSSILDMHGLALVEKDPGSSVFSVVPRPVAEQVPMVTRSFGLKFSTVSDVSPVVRNMLPQGGTLTEFPSRNLLVVRSTAENLSEIKEIIEQVDQPTKQVCIETKFMEMNDEVSKQLGIRWDSLESFSATLQAGPFSRTDTRQRDFSRGDTLSQTDNRSRSDILNKLYDKNNVQFEDSTVEFKPLFPEATSPSDFFAEYTITPTRTLDDRVELSRQIATDVRDTFTKTIAETRASVLDLDRFQLVLSALKKTDGVSIISNPKLIVANGSTNAFFSVGEREPIIKTSITRGTQDSPGDQITAELDTSINTDHIKQGYLETGIDLRVIPTVKTDDLIEAEITPSLKRKVGEKTIEENSWPIISVKEIRTRFTLRSGQTVAIGGLTDTGDQKQTTKVPLLGDIPFIGKYLFTHTRDVKRQVETIIFVTLSIASPERLLEASGIPDNAELVHKQLLERRTRRMMMEREVEALREETDEKERESARETRGSLLKRRKP